MPSTSAETPGAELPSLPLPGASPGEVRAALHPEFRTAFDLDYSSSSTAVYEVDTDDQRRVDVVSVTWIG